MSEIRQSKIESIIQKELSVVFQRESRTLCLNSMVTVTIVRVSPDLSIAKCYLSVFMANDKEQVINNLKANIYKIKKHLGRSMKNLKKTPEIILYLDDSIDYAEKIDKLLKK